MKSIKDFIKIADAFGKDSAENAKKVEEGLGDYVFQKLGIDISREEVEDINQAGEEDGVSAKDTAAEEIITSSEPPEQPVPNQDEQEPEDSEENTQSTQDTTPDATSTEPPAAPAQPTAPEPDQAPQADTTPPEAPQTDAENDADSADSGNPTSRLDTKGETPAADPDANDPRGDQTNPPAAPQTDAELDADSADSGVDTTDDARAARTNAPQTDAELDADSADNAPTAGPDDGSRAGQEPNAAPQGNALAGRLDTETPSLLDAYNDGGRQAMDNVRDLQQGLERLGFDPNGVDGKYGRGTYAAVQEFQRQNGLAVDGEAGPATMAKLQELLNARNGQQPAEEEPAGGGAEETPAQGQEAPTAGPDDGTRGGQQPNAPAQATPEPTAGPDDGTRGGQQPNATAPAQEPAATNEPVPSRLKIRQNIAPEVEKLLQLASKDFAGLMAIMEGKGLAEALDPPQKAQLQKYLDQIRASAKRDPQVNVEFGDLIRRIESALGIQNNVRQTGGDGPEEVNPDDEAQDIANVKAIQQRQTDAQAAGEDPDANDPRGDQITPPQTSAELDSDSQDNARPEPAAPRVSDEKGMQSNGSIVNFNINQFKQKGTYIDLPDRNNDGFVVRVYGDRAALEKFIQNDRRGRGKTIQGGGATTGSGSPTPTDVQDRTRGTRSVQAGVPDAERDGQERGVQTASKDFSMKNSIVEEPIDECGMDMQAPEREGSPVSMSVNLNASGEQHVQDLIRMMQLAGAKDAAPVADMHSGPHDQHDDMVSMMQMMDAPEESVEEEWDNTPEESYADHQTMTKDLSGGINRQKKAYAKAQDGDNAMAVENSIKEHLRAALEGKYANDAQRKAVHAAKNKKKK